ncbi:MAG: tetratricopeptide repeat protein [Acidobacteriota bacterium]
MLYLVSWQIISSQASAAQQSATYEEEYALYQKANGETNAVEKRALLMQFVKKYSKSELDTHISGLYAQFYAEPRRAGEWQRLATLAEEFLRYRPSDVYAMAAATEAYQKLNSPQKLVEFGTRLYAQSPNGATAYFVAKAYQSLNDRVNFSKWVDKTLQHDPGNVEMLVEAISSAWSRQDLTKAASFANRGLKALDTMSPPAGQNTAEWKAKTDQIRAYCLRALGEEDYLKNAFPDAQKHFMAAVKLDPKNDMAHYRLGFLYWRAGAVDKGCASFARAAVLNGPTSSDARKQLNDLYKQSYHNLLGVPKLLQSAKNELGVK